MFEVLESARFVARESSLVRVNPEAVASFARELASSRSKPPPWEASFHLGGPPERVAAYLLVLDTINFCFWPPPGAERWEVTHKGRTVSGYNGLALALKLAVERGVPITDADFLREITPEVLGGILGGRGALRLMEERSWALRELGEVLARDYGGEAVRVVESVKGWAVSLARLLARKLRSFRDTASYRERGIFFYKRAQIFPADLHGALGGRGLGEFRDMENLTAFADYKLPQVLRHLGILAYEPSLAAKVDSGVHLDPGGAEEVEIRANTIVAVDMISRETTARGHPLRPFEIDGILWHLGQESAFRQRPYHRTATVFY